MAWVKTKQEWENEQQWEAHIEREHEQRMKAGWVEFPEERRAEIEAELRRKFPGLFEIQREDGMWVWPVYRDGKWQLP